MNKKLVSKIILTALLLSLLFMLSSCEASDLSLGLYQLFGGFIMVVVGFIVSIFSAIVSAILGIIMFIIGFFTTIGGLIATALQFIGGIF